MLLFLLLLNAIHADESPKQDVSHVIVLPSGAVYEGDYFAFGDSVEISGIVNGDVYVLANQVVIDGTVNGDVIVGAVSLEIAGKVAHNVRSVGGQVLVTGQIGNNFSTLAGNVQLLPSSTVARNLVITAGNVDLACQGAYDGVIVASNLRVSGMLKGFLKAYVGQLRITSKANIVGNVEYRSSAAAWIDPAARMEGTVIYHPSLVHGLVQGTWLQRLLVGSKVVTLLMNFFYTLVVGIILLKVFPKNLEAALHTLQDHPLKCFSYGVMLLVLLPLASLVMLMTILGVPFALTLIAANIIGFYTAKIYTIFWASQWLFHRIKLRVRRFVVLVVGIVCYFILSEIPFFGLIFAFVAMLLGLGAGVLAQARRRLLPN
jgi:cytoskeletal protein CcmA (bactofilin family)